MRVSVEVFALKLEIMVKCQKLFSFRGGLSRVSTVFGTDKKPTVS